jgi:hypothetical protein
MGIFDKAKGMLKKNDAKVEQGIDKAADMADDKMGDTIGSDRIDSGAEYAKDAADKIAES